MCVCVWGGMISLRRRRISLILGTVPEIKSLQGSRRENDNLCISIRIKKQSMQYVNFAQKSKKRQIYRGTLINLRVISFVRKLFPFFPFLVILLHSWHGDPSLSVPPFEERFDNCLYCIENKRLLY